MKRTIIHSRQFHVKKIKPFVFFFKQNFKSRHKWISKKGPKGSSAERIGRERERREKDVERLRRRVLRLSSQTVAMFMIKSLSPLLTHPITNMSFLHFLYTVHNFNFIGKHSYATIFVSQIPSLYLHKMNNPTIPIWQLFSMVWQS